MYLCYYTSSIELAGENPAKTNITPNKMNLVNFYSKLRDLAEERYSDNPAFHTVAKSLETLVAVTKKPFEGPLYITPELWDIFEGAIVQVVSKFPREGINWPKVISLAADIKIITKS